LVNWNKKGSRKTHFPCIQKISKMELSRNHELKRSMQDEFNGNNGKIQGD
jgi:hypothetical protein